MASEFSQKYNANHTLGHPYAGSERQVAKKRHLGSKGGAPGSENGFPNLCFWHQVLLISGYFPHSILDVIYASFSKANHDFRVAFGDNLAYICLTFLKPVEPYFFADRIGF